MNRNCHGHFLTVKDKDYYRCIYDGELIDTDLRECKEGRHCPNCHREINATEKSLGAVDIRRIVIVRTEYFIPSIGWIEYREKSMEIE